MYQYFFLDKGFTKQQSIFFWFWGRIPDLCICEPVPLSPSVVTRSSEIHAPNASCRHEFQSFGRVFYVPQCREILGQKAACILTKIAARFVCPGSGFWTEHPPDCPDFSYLSGRLSDFSGSTRLMEGWLPSHPDCQV